jgi:hypothetical protein
MSWPIYKGGYVFPRDEEVACSLCGVKGGHHCEVAARINAGNTEYASWIHALGVAERLPAADQQRNEGGQ